jgi:hypothetical protein
MTDYSQQTWRYLHGPDDTLHLSFKTSGVPRSFSVIQYVATENLVVDFDHNGIAIIDNDTLSVVLDGHLKGKDLKQEEFMSSARKMDWNEFSSFCAAHPRYRSRSDDIGMETPNPGVLVNQIQRGVMYAPVNEEDIRSPSMIAANVDPGCPYKFPEKSRSQMIAEVLDHNCLKDEKGNWRISWDTNLDEQSTVIGSSDQTDQSTEDWKFHYEANPEIFHHITGEILEPFFSGKIGTWPPSDAGRYSFTSGGLQNATSMCLESIDGADIGFTSKGDMGKFLNDLPDSAVRDVWKLLIVVDRDLSNEVVEKAFSRRLKDIRSEFEAQQDPMPTPV